MHVTLNTSLNFKRRLRPSEEADYSAVLKQGKEKVGNTGHSMLIVPSASLPQETNTGVGNLLDEEGKKFVDFAKQYWGINYIQLLPEGQFKVYGGNCFLPYSGSALDIGSQVINLKLLTSEEYGKLLTIDDVNKVVNSNKISAKDTKINFENVLKLDSPQEDILRKAYNELLKADTQKKKNLLEEIKNFAQANKEWLEPKAIYEALSAKYKNRDTRAWNEFDHNFYNTDIVSPKQRQDAIKGIRNGNLGKEADFFEFKQFIADKHLAKAKAELNQKGIKLSGDMLLGFSYDEVWANPKAFLENAHVGWGLPALNLDAPEGENILRNKVRNFAKRYDGIRIDASWAYVNQPIKEAHSDRIISRKGYDSKILDIIDDEVLNVKGKDFNLENITHEFVADVNDFNVFEGTKLRPLAKDRVKIYTSFNLNSNWATVDAYKKRGWKDGSYLLGATNHDAFPLRVEFQNSTKRAEQIDVLSKILKIPKEKLDNIQGFIQAKFAEPIRSKHNMFFFTDALNILDRYKQLGNNSENYRTKIPKNYQENYFKALEKGEGFNIMDALEKAFVADGLDKKEPELFERIVKYRKILQAHEKTGLSKLLIGSIVVGIGVVIGGICVFLNKNKKAGNTGSNAQSFN